jgi:hypothetical protein
MSSSPKPQDQPSKQDETPSDAEIIAFEQHVKEQESLSRPLVGPLEPMDDLSAEYANGSPVFIEKINVRFLYRR